MKKPLKKFPIKVSKYKDVFNKKLNSLKCPTKVYSNQLIYGFYGLQSLIDFKIGYKEVEALRRVISFKFKSIKIWFRLEFNIPLRSKPAGSRMGKGKGKLSNWVADIKKGSVFMEIDCIPDKNLLTKIFKLLTQKLRVKTKVIFKKKYSITPK